MSAHVSLVRRPATHAAALVLAATLGLAGCSQDSEETGPATPSEPIRVTVTDDEVSPMGERFEVEAGEPFDVEITADREGSLHVHTSPEQEWEFTEGTTELEATVDQPGVVEVELHDPDLVVLQLEVR